jgi:hypothetical protein
MSGFPHRRSSCWTYLALQPHSYSTCVGGSLARLKWDNRDDNHSPASSARLRKRGVFYVCSSSAFMTWTSRTGKSYCLFFFLAYRMNQSRTLCVENTSVRPLSVCLWPNVSWLIICPIFMKFGVGVFQKSCRTSLSFVKIVLVTFMAHLKAWIKFFSRSLFTFGPIWINFDTGSVGKKMRWLNMSFVRMLLKSDKRNLGTHFCHCLTVRLLGTIRIYTLECNM